MRDEKTCDNKGMTIELQLILHCAPVLKGIKAANTITLQRNDLESSLRALKGTGIHAKTIYQDQKIAVVLVYRQERLLFVMNQVSYCAYMLQLGYRPLNIEESIRMLCIRMYEYYKKQQEFPHELGVFLEYPLIDIKEFMRQDGKNYKLCGYWKVYDEEERANQIFMSYDAAKKEMLRSYLRYGILDISSSISGF